MKTLIKVSFPRALSCAIALLISHAGTGTDSFQPVEGSVVELSRDQWEKVGADQDAVMDILSADEFTLSWGEILDDRDDIGGRSAIFPILELADGESVTFSFEITDIIAVASSSGLPLRFGILNDLSADSGNIGGFLAHVQWGEPVNATKAYAAVNSNGNVFSMGDQVLQPITDAPGIDDTLTDGNTVSFSITIARFDENNYGLQVVWGSGEEAQVIEGVGIISPAPLSHFNRVFVLINRPMPAGASFRVTNPRLTKQTLKNTPEEDLVGPVQDLVEALPETTPEEKVKKAVLQIAVERATNAQAVSLFDERDALLQNIEAALSQTASDFTSRNPTAGNLPVLRPLLTKNQNPYLEALVQDANEDMAVADVPWPRATLGNPTLKVGGNYGSRDAYRLMNNYIWLFAHEESPLQHHPELLKRILRRAHAYFDALEIDPDGGITEPTPLWYDQFSIASAFPALYELYHLYPSLLLPSQKARWETIIEQVGNELDKLPMANPDREPWNHNIETGRMIGLLVTGLWTGDQNRIESVLSYTDKVIDRIRPDGAIPYHGEGEPSVNYHNELIYEWLKIYELTGYDRLRTALRDTQWKGPVMGRTDEFWTSPFFKTYRWNYEAGTEAGLEAVATLSQNPYLRWLLDRDMFSSYTQPGSVVEYRDQVAWYDPDLVTAEPLPDKYTIPDRNVGGPRGWYGNFNYAGVFRPNPAEMEGRETLMGAMTVDSNTGRLNSILTAVTPRIWMTPEDTVLSNGNTMSAWGILTLNSRNSTTITRNYSVGSSIHGTTNVYADAYQGENSGWLSRQLWIGLPDRIIGLVSTTPAGDDAEAYAVHGVLRLISGGTAGAETAKVLEEIIPGQHYRYGQLEIIVHGSTYASLTGLEVDYRRDKFPATELTFSDRATEPTPAGELKSYTADTDYRFVVEIRPAWADDSVSISILEDPGLLGLELISPDRSMRTWLGVEGTQTVNSQRESLPSGQASLTLSDRRNVLAPPIFDSMVPETFSLRYGQHAVLIVSPDLDDHRPGWESFAHMVGHAWAHYEVNSVGWVDTGDWLGFIHPNGDFIYSEKLSNFLYLPQESVSADSGAFAFAFRDPDIPSLINGFPLENDVLPDSGLVDTQSWLGWLYMSQQGWAYSYSLESWIWIAEPEATGAGAWIYIFRF